MLKFVNSEIRIRSSAKTILSCLLYLKHLKQWWGVDSCFIEPKDGGLYALTWLRTFEGIKFISTGRIKFYNPRTHLHLEDMIYINSEKPILGPFTINFDVDESSTYSILSIKQRGFQKGGVWDWYFQAVSDGWPQALVMLKSYVEKLES